MINGRMMSAIKLTTASSICAVLDMIVAGALPNKGLVLQEEIKLERFLANRFGRVYAQEAAPLGHVSNAA
jgi:saccharopine dehydrogenase-like NADP-dependent oxidoreductase